MRIACPNCAAAYDVPDALLAAGPRRLRCARCGTEFLAALPPAAPPPAPESPPEFSRWEVAEATPEPPVDEPAPTPDLAAPELTAPPRERPRPTRGPAGPSPIAPEDATAAPGQVSLAAAWIASLGVIGAGLFALLHWQAEIAAAWPPAARFYAALGLS